MTVPNKKYKIALIGHRLSDGGGEKVMANLSIFFDKVGIEVHNIIVLDGVTYSYGGQLVNLGLLKNKRNDWYNKLSRFIFLKKYLKNQKFDFIIDFRPRMKPLQELILTKFIFKTKTIFTVHSYLLQYYMPNNKWFTRLIYIDAFAMVTCVDDIKNLVAEKYALKNLKTIYNPVNFDEIKDKIEENVLVDFTYIVAVGQYNDGIKQFDKLIACYAQSILPQKNIHLMILGKGNFDFLNSVIIANDVQNLVHLMGFQDNPFKYIIKSKFLVLSSLNEGFANVIVESLACEIPVVAFDCLCGPSTILEDKFNGLLIENQNCEKLTEAMNLFIEDEILYNYCKKNTLNSIQHFALDNIGKQWLDLMKIDL
ncbi:hypothetical protein FFWV33_11485 [Flavobacterium faecale]|uniref:Glycosyl transferase family 1 domain-containing protein n=1 Tax=Flavobacterium faecale TaxID=1355330 RepID=A0A2S1LEG1_9FLAO|nr:glycosyltransferase [Flavobacterium faecale]AWG22089.1 hypothetical protein FFWV33_11485 [Flavobacterium faecale]